MARLRYTTAAGEQVHPLGERFSVGRDAHNDLALATDPQVSSWHLRVRMKGEGYVVEDLASRNGTYLERGGTVVRVRDATPLQPGDVIRLGSTRLVFEADPAPAEPPAPLDLAGSVLPPVTTQGYRPTVRGRVVPVMGPPAAAPPDALQRIDDLERRVAQLEADLAELRAARRPPSAP